MIAIEGVFVDRSVQNLEPCFIRGEPPSNVNVAEVVKQASRRVIRKLRHLGYLESGIEVPVATSGKLGAAGVRNVLAAHGL